MKTDISITPRKRPKQERSRATVEAILDATARVLVRDGFDSASTNQIARVAGVSVGSLYQYFPNKESLVAALVERNLESVVGQVRQCIDATADQPFAVATRAIIECIMRFYAAEPELHRVLVEQIPRTGQLAKDSNLTEKLVALACEILVQRRADMRDLDLKIAGFVVAEAIEGIIQAATTSDIAPALDDPAFIDEVSLLISRYLQPGFAEVAGADKPL